MRIVQHLHKQPTGRQLGCHVWNGFTESRKTPPNQIVWSDHCKCSILTTKHLALKMERGGGGFQAEAHQGPGQKCTSLHFPQSLPVRLLYVSGFKQWA